MRKLLLNISILMVALLAATPAMAYDFEEDGIYYSIVSMSRLEVEVTHGDAAHGGKGCYKGHVRIPATVKHRKRQYRVVAIGDYAFSHCSRVAEVELPAAVRRIGECAFRRCTELSAIELPTGLEEIGYKAFEHSGIATVVMPGGVRTVGGDAFSNCHELSTVVIGSGVRTMGNNVFNNCWRLLEVFCLPVQCPKGLTPGSFSSAHRNCEVYVPSSAAYGFGIDYITFDTNRFAYDGTEHAIKWTNNLKAYDCSVPHSRTLSSEGRHSVNLTVTYTGGIDLKVSIPYAYEVTAQPLTTAVEATEK